MVRQIFYTDIETFRINKCTGSGFFNKHSRFIAVGTHKFNFHRLLPFLPMYAAEGLSGFKPTVRILFIVSSRINKFIYTTIIVVRMSVLGTGAISINCWNGRIRELIMSPTFPPPAVTADALKGSATLARVGPTLQTE